MNQNDRLRLNVTIGRNPPQYVSFLGPQVTVGRSHDNILCVPSSFISRHHGSFTRKGDGWYYHDQNPKNATTIFSPGGETVRSEQQPYQLQGSDRIKMGDVLIEVLPFYSSPVPPDPTLIHSVWNVNKAMTLLDSPERGGHGALRQLFEAARKLSACQTEGEVFEVVCKVVQEALPPVTHLFLCEPEAQRDRFTLRYQWTRNVRETDSKDGELPPQFSHSLLAQVLKNGQSIYYSPTEVARSATASMVISNIISTVCVPLPGAQGYLGVLQADCRTQGQTLLERDQHFITLLGEHLATNLDRFRTAQRIERMFEGFVKASVKAIESRDPYTAGHSSRVATYCLDVADAISNSQEAPFLEHTFSEVARRELRYAALLHDFGKVGVREDVLLKAAKLSPLQLQQVGARFRLARMEIRALVAEQRFKALRSNAAVFYEELEQDQELRERLAFLDAEEEWLMKQMDASRIEPSQIPRLEELTRPGFTSVRLLEPEELRSMLECRGTLTPMERQHIEQHAYITKCYLEEIPWPDELRGIPEIAGAHHEKLNGRGYPRGLGEQQLPLQVRILTVCDIFDAVTANGRPYIRKPFTQEQAFDILEQDVRANALDPAVVRVLRTVVSKEPQET